MENKNMRKLNVTVQCMAVYNRLTRLTLANLSTFQIAMSSMKRTATSTRKKTPTLIVGCFMKLALRSQKSLAPGQRTAMLYVSRMKSVLLKNSITVDGTICTG